MKSMVDERFECAAVICRLAGRPEFSSSNYGAFNTDYHKEVANTFAPFANHEAVEFVKIGSNNIRYDKVLKFIVHIIKVNGKFVFIDNISSLTNSIIEKNAIKFLELFNKFYEDTNYSDFYNSHLPLFEEYSQKFFDETYQYIDLKWFDKYIDSSNLRCILSLSSGNYGATVNDKNFYILVNYSTYPPFIHEYCHFFANKIAFIWYNENDEFRKWCDEGVNLEKMPYYREGKIIACEYVTRAYNILYDVEHGKNLEECLAKERDCNYNDSFKKIENVYKMILEFNYLNS